LAQTEEILWGFHRTICLFTKPETFNELPLLLEKTLICWVVHI